MLGGRMCWWASVHGCIRNKLPVVCPQNIESTIFAAGSNNLSWRPIDIERQDLRRITYRSIFVEASLGIVGPHRVGPHISGIDLRVPLPLPRGCVNCND